MAKKKEIIVLVDNCVMRLNLDALLCDCKITGIRKIIASVFQEPQRNTETIATMDKYIPLKVAEAKEEWKKASDWYRATYESTVGMIDSTARKFTDKRNLKRLQKVKQAKANYERYEKIAKYYQKYRNKETD